MEAFEGYKAERQRWGIWFEKVQQKNHTHPSGTLSQSEEDWYTRDWRMWWIKVLCLTTLFVIIIRVFANLKQLHRIMCEGTWQLKNSRTLLLLLKLPLLTLLIWWPRNDLENFQSSTDEEEAPSSPLLVSVPYEAHQKPSSSTSFLTHEHHMPFAHLQQADHWRCLTALQIHIRKGLCVVVKSPGFRVFIQAHGLRSFAGCVSLAELLGLSKTQFLFYKMGMTI